MASRDRDTYIHRLGVSPETASVISSKNRIYATPADSAGRSVYQIGVVASFDPNESKSVEPVRGIGYGDHVAELVPGVTQPMTLSVTRTAQYLSMLQQVFGYRGGIDGLVRSLRHHKWPFDIVQEILISQYIATGSGTKDNLQGVEGVDNSAGLNPDGIQAIMTYYEGCWIQDYSASYSADAALVQETCSVQVTDIVSGAGADYSTYEMDDKLLFNANAKSRIMTGTLDSNTGRNNATIAP
jgi:hypothetical protein